MHVVYMLQIYSFYSDHILKEDPYIILHIHSIIDMGRILPYFEEQGHKGLSDRDCVTYSCVRVTCVYVLEGRQLHVVTYRRLCKIIISIKFI